ncbi:type II secretion system F family protein [Desulfitobacterium sp.]|nr:type II secretion system F family protein [Desulfitobacterium sp.]MEA4900443.1 type II secretion system F family protein [Desulfitobacterium sp.]
MQFKYKIIDENMAVVEGAMEAVDLDTAKQNMVENHWQVISLREVPSIDSVINRKFEGKVKYETVSSFCSQLAMMIRSGANLVRGLDILKAQVEDKRLKSVLKIIFEGVSRGNSLSQSMRDCKGALPDLLVNLVAVGEESGSLDTVLTSMAEYYERENFIRKKISSVAVYPVILTLVLIGLIILFINVILPSIADLMTQTGQSLPLVTQILINSAMFLKTNAFYLLLGFVAALFAYKRISLIPRVRYFIDDVKLHIPVLGKNIHNIIIARFARTLALFLHSSIPIVTILNSMETIMGNKVPSQALARIKEKVMQGDTLTSAFGEEQFFDPLVIQMMSIGEETGRLEELMGEIANHYDRSVEIGIARMTALIEPIFTVVIGVFAGIMIISIALPIMNMSSAIQ